MLRRDSAMRLSAYCLRVCCHLAVTFIFVIASYKILCRRLVAPGLDFLVEEDLIPQGLTPLLTVALGSWGAWLMCVLFVGLRALAANGRNVNAIDVRGITLRTAMNLWPIPFTAAYEYLTSPGFNPSTWLTMLGTAQKILGI